MVPMPRFLSPHVGRVVAVFALTAILYGCASRPEPALNINASAPQPDVASVVEVFAVTTRRPSSDQALRFSGQRTLAPSFAEVAVSIPRSRKAGEIQWPGRGAADLSQSFGTLRFETLERDAFGKRLLTRASKKNRHVLVFVHGYNTRFDEAVFRLAQIVHDSGAEVTPVLFSWASWASLGSYPYDRESAALARDSLELLLTKLADNPSVGQVSVLAHSMGGWLTLETMRQMVIRKGGFSKKLQDVMLAAPDVDVEVALSHAHILEQARSKPNLTLFVSSDDKALEASRRIWGSTDRLGAIDPAKEPYKSILARSGVTVFDLTSVQSGDALQHGKFAQSGSVVTLIGQRLSKQALESEGSNGGVLHTIGKSAGNAIETVIAAPSRLGEKPLPSSLDVER